MDKIPTQYVYNYDKPQKTDRSVAFYSRTPAGSGSKACNEKITDRALVVNCMGKIDLPFSFTTHELQGRHDYYLMYLLSGELDATVCGKKSRIVPGDAVIFPPETEYRYAPIGDSDIQYLWVHFTGSDAESLLTRFGFGGGIFKVGIDESIVLLFMTMMEEFILRDAYTEESTAAKMISLFIALRRKLESNAERPNGSLARVFKSLKHIHANFKLPLTNEQLAGIEHLSVSQYIELFKKCTGKTPRSYIIELRIQSACELLMRSDLTIAQIAQSVGYDDPHYFSRLFKTHRRTSPDAYRTELLGSEANE